MFVYEFKCLNCLIHFEVKQAIHDEHIANCPECGHPTHRIFTSPKWYYSNPEPLFHKDGSYEEPPNL